MRERLARDAAKVRGLIDTIKSPGFNRAKLMNASWIEKQGLGENAVRILQTLLDARSKITLVDSSVGRVKASAERTKRIAWDSFRSHLLFVGASAATAIATYNANNIMAGFATGDSGMDPLSGNSSFVQNATSAGEQSFGETVTGVAAAVASGATSLASSAMSAVAYTPRWLVSQPFRIARMVGLAGLEGLSGANTGSADAPVTAAPVPVPAITSNSLGLQITR